MNLLLLEQSEIEHATVELSERRASHLINVLKVRPGDQLRTGVVGLGSIAAHVEAVGPASVVLSLGEITPTPPPTLHLVLAIPRPKALSRIVQAMSSFGAASITLTNAWKVEKSYLASPRLHPERLREDALVGCEQGRQCHLPTFRILNRLTEFMEHHADTSLSSTSKPFKCLLHPEAPQTLSACLNDPDLKAKHDSETLLAIGPDGGFIPREIETFANAGYEVARLNVGPLRTEVALAAALGVFSASSRCVSSHLL